MLRVPQENRVRACWFWTSPALIVDGRCTTNVSCRFPAGSAASGPPVGQHGGEILAQALRPPQSAGRGRASGHPPPRSALSLPPRHFRGRHHAATIFVVLLLAV